MPHTIHYEVGIPAPPERVYEVLTDAARFSQMTGGDAADFDAREGGAFSCFNDMITGRFVELVPGERVVQAWRVANWEPGVFSIVRFELLAEAEGTRLVMDHTGFPEEHHEHLDPGWAKKYWTPLQAMFAPQK